jgi:hypothetical protein
MLNRKIYPTKFEMLLLFDYHEDGYLIRKSNGKAIGNNPNYKGKYYQVGLAGDAYCIHKCIFIMHQKEQTFAEICKRYATENNIQNGEMDNFVVDHIDRNTHNNKVENLRILTCEENWNNSDNLCDLQFFLNMKNGGFKRNVGGTH